MQLEISSLIAPLSSLLVAQGASDPIGPALQQRHNIEPQDLDSCSASCNTSDSCCYLFINYYYHLLLSITIISFISTNYHSLYQIIFTVASHQILVTIDRTWVHSRIQRARRAFTCIIHDFRPQRFQSAIIIIVGYIVAWWAFRGRCDVRVTRCIHGSTFLPLATFIWTLFFSIQHDAVRDGLISKNRRETTAFPVYCESKITWFIWT